MDDDLHEFEAELKRLRPSAPSRRLSDRVAIKLNRYAVAPRSTPVRWWWSALLPAAAAVAVILLSYSLRPVETTSVIRPVAAGPSERPTVDSRLKPITAENVLVAARDEGLVTLADGTAARRERLQFVDTITWENPRTNASLRWSVPREEVRIIPVVFQ